MNIRRSAATISDFFPWVQTADGPMSLPYLVLFSADLGFSLRFQGCCLIRGVPFGWQLFDGLVPSGRSVGDIYLIDLESCQQPQAVSDFQNTDGSVRFVWIGSPDVIQTDLLDNEASLGFLTKSLGTEYIVDRTIEMANRPKRRKMSC